MTGGRLGGSPIIAAMMLVAVTVAVLGFIWGSYITFIVGLVVLGANWALYITTKK